MEYRPISINLRLSLIVHINTYILGRRIPVCLLHIIGMHTSKGTRSKGNHVVILVIRRIFMQTFCLMRFHLVEDVYSAMQMIYS